MVAYYNEIDPHAAQHLRNLIDAGHIAPGVVDTRSIEDVTPNDWIDLVQADVEALGYAFGAIAFPSASVGAPHQRDRAYWVADADCQQWERRREFQPTGGGKPSDSGVISGLAHTDGNGRERRLSGRTDPQREAIDGQARCGCAACGLADANHEQRPFTLSARSYADISRKWNKDSEAATGCSGAMRPGPVNGFWRDTDWLFSQDGKWRPVRPGSFPLANGVPARVGRLRAYGNAINIEAAAAFIKAYMAAEQ